MKMRTRALRELLAQLQSVFSCNRRNAARRRKKPTVSESLESRQFLSASHDLIGLTALRQDPAFAGIDGSGVSVVVIDSGLDTSHPDIADNYLTGLDIVTGVTTPTNIDSHGTHVAGIVGSTNSEIGVATGVNLIAIQAGILDGTGRVGYTNFAIEESLRWVLEHREQYNIVAVNMSLGGGLYASPDDAATDPILDEISALESQGVAVVSSAGNDFGDLVINNEDPTLTGAPGVLSTFNVGAVYDEIEQFTDAEGNTRPLPYWARAATGYDVALGQLGVVYTETMGPDRIAEFTQRGRPSDSATLFAPGKRINSTVPGGYEEYDGTSMAAPAVSGAVALVQEAALEFGGRLLSVPELQSIILTSADTIHDGDDEDVKVIRGIDADFDFSDRSAASQYAGTGNTYKRLNVYNAVKSVRAFFPPRQDADGVLTTSVNGPLLKPANSGALSPIGRIIEKEYGSTVIAGEIGRDSFTRFDDRRATEQWDVTAKDVDVYRFVVSSHATLTVQTQSDSLAPHDFDTFLRLYNAQGAIV
ncbi:MAG: S8 family serine peptidase, partial [Planctomycetaceae bacterium]